MHTGHTSKVRVAMIMVLRNCLQKYLYGSCNVPYSKADPKSYKCRFQIDSDHSGLRL